MRVKMRLWYIVDVDECLLDRRVNKVDGRDIQKIVLINFGYLLNVEDEREEFKNYYWQF